MTNGHTEKISILVVDDSRVVRLAAAKMFSDDFDVSLAVDGVDAMRLLKADTPIHVVLTDLAMPEMDGFELLDAIRQSNDEKFRDLPVIIATGAGNTGAAKQKAFSLGATDFVSKPFDAIDLKARVRSYARFQETTQSLKEQVTVDELTGLMNNKGIVKQLDKELSFVSRHKSTMNVLHLEIDQYKDLFVRIGRNGTEKLINKVAEVLEKTFRKEDSIARSSLAGFTVSLPMSDPDKVLDVANRLTDTIESFKATLDGNRIKITVSTGIASLDYNDQIGVSELMAVLEKALYLAKKQGASQLKKLTITEYRAVLEHEARHSLSIDSLLTDIDNGNAVSAAGQLESALIRLSPLLELLSNEQFQHLFELRQHKSNNVVTINQYRK